VDEEHASPVIAGKGPADLPVQAAYGDVDLDRAGDGAAVRRPADPEGMQVALARDGTGVKPQAGPFGPEDPGADALPGMTDPDGDPAGHMGPQRPQQLAPAAADDRFIVQDPEHREAP